MDGLIVKQPWASLIVQGKKTMEVRGSKTKKKRENIAIIESGMNHILGDVYIIECVELDKETFERTREQHRIKMSYEDVLTNFGYKKLYGWVLGTANEVVQPVICQNRKVGQVIWVKDALPDDVYY
ncbi:ASCH domain-containing protein, partial [Niameybacter massiliensis]